jgi:hypothetical protein
MPITSSAIASATLEPHSSEACMLPSTHIAGRARSGWGPIVSSGMSRPSGVLPIIVTRTSFGWRLAQSRTCCMSCA